MGSDHEHGTRYTVEVAHRPSSPPSLRDWHRGRGARFESSSDCGIIADYGDAAAEYQALVEGAAVHHDARRRRLELRGEDRVRFLGGLVTCELRQLGPGDGAYGFLTDVKGRVLAECVVRSLADRLLVELAGVVDPAEVEAHLRRYLVADRVEIEPDDGMVPLVLMGPRAGEAVGDACAMPSGELRRWGHAAARLGGVEVVVARDEHRGTASWIAWLPASVAVDVAEDLVERRGLCPAGATAVELVRVEAAIPAFGVDFGPENLPQETGLEEEAVSYEKGCYLGQEIVSRLHYRGQTARRMCRLEIEGSEVPGPGPLFHEGREAGRLTSAVASPRFGGPVGLGVLQRRVESGSRVETAGGISVSVHDLAATDVPRETSKADPGA